MQRRVVDLRAQRDEVARVVDDRPGARVARGAAQSDCAAQPARRLGAAALTASEQRRAIGHAIRPPHSDDTDHQRPGLSPRATRALKSARALRRRRADSALSRRRAASAGPAAAGTSVAMRVGLGLIQVKQLLVDGAIDVRIRQKAFRRTALDRDPQELGALPGPRWTAWPGARTRSSSARS